MEKTPKRLLSDYILLELEKMSPEELDNNNISKSDLKNIDKLNTYLIFWVLSERRINITPIIVEYGDWYDNDTMYKETYKINDKFIQYKSGEDSTKGEFSFVQLKQKISYYYE
jgi:hypothetical protein